MQVEHEDSLICYMHLFLIIICNKIMGSISENLIEWSQEQEKVFSYLTFKNLNCNQNYF